MKQATTELDEATPSLWRRLAWFATIWTASVAVLIAVAWIIRAVLS